MYEKLKSILTDDAFFMALLLILVGAASFGLGRQSVTEKGVEQVSALPSNVVITEKPLNSKDIAPVDHFEVKKLVASKSGTKYHLLTCPGAKQIKESNKIYFDSVEMAKAAGYTPAANCQDL